MSSAAAPSPLGAATLTAAQARVVDAALELFGEHGIAGTSLQMIADAIGVTKAAVYHQYNTKDEIVLAVAQVVLAGLEAAVGAADAERSRARGREVLIAGMIDLAIARRRMASVIQRDPVMLRFLEGHAPVRRVMERANRLLMGATFDARARVRAAALASAIAGSVLHPLAQGLDDDTLRAELLRQTRRLLPTR